MKRNDRRRFSSHFHVWLLVILTRGASYSRDGGLREQQYRVRASPKLFRAVRDVTVAFVRMIRTRRRERRAIAGLIDQLFYHSRLYRCA